MKKIGRLLLSLLMIVSISGCAQESKNEESVKDDTLQIICPTGAPSLSLVSVYEDITKNGKIDFVDGSDQLVAQLSKANSEYNVIIAPINVGAKLIAGKQSNYKMAGVLTWGNLYLVGTGEDALQSQGEIALFGQGAVPGMIYDHVKIDTTLTPQYYNSATLVQQQLLSSKASVGMLAEPLATATIAKAKENGLTLSIIKDLQKEYGKDGYPQATVFVKEGTNCDQFIKKVDDFTNGDYKDLDQYLEKVGTDTLGLPAAAIVEKTIDRQNLHYIDIHDCQDQVKDFLKLYNIQFSKDMMK